MADTVKYVPISGGNLILERKPHFSLIKTQRAKVCVYGCVFVFVAFTIFLAFGPSPISSSPWFTNVFSLTSSSDGSVSMPTSSSSIFSDEAYRSHFSSIYFYFFPNNSQQSQNFTASPPYNAPAPQSNSSSEMLSLSEVPKNQTHANDTVEVLKPLNQSAIVNITAASESSSGSHKEPSTVNNQTQSNVSDDKVGVLKSDSNLSSIEDQKSPVNQTVGSLPKSGSGEKNVTGKGENTIAEKGVLRNFTSSFEKKHNNGTSSSASATHGSEDLIKSLLNCDFFDGNWVKDESYPLYKPGSCSLIDEQFDCFLNGRPDSEYNKYRWNPNACTLPRLNATHMLEILRGKRLVFVGDSLNRNMWESLVCILRSSVKDQKKVYEKSGSQDFREKVTYSFVFEDYNCTVEFFVAPFLVQEWEIADKKGQKKETLRLDLVSKSADEYKDADIIIFNTGHWWTHEKTYKGEDYYQEGNHVYPQLDVLEAFRKALVTWGGWIDAHINSSKTLVLFRGYSSSHFSGGQWNSGGACDHEVEPIKNETYLESYPPMMEVLEGVLKGIKTPVSYLNITRMSDFRKDAHPSMYRTQNFTEEERSPSSIQDCSHWCLPGVPDNWNEILYAEILVNQYQKQQQTR